MSTIRLPWSDPALASPEDIEGRVALDMNQGFRAFLLSKAFKAHLAAELKQEIRSLERGRELAGTQVWRLYRAHRLNAVLETALSTEADLDTYLHLLGTGAHWYFTNRSARSYGADTGALDDIGRAFEEYLRGQSIPAGSVAIEDPAQKPFALLLQRHLGEDARDTVEPPEDVEIYPEIRSLSDAARFFRKSPDRLLRVRWSPRDSVTPRLRRYLKDLHGHRIPVALEFAPRTEAEDPDAFVFEAMDEILRVQHWIRRLTVRTPKPGLGDMAQVQLEAELDDPRLLAPHRARRLRVSPASRLTAADPVVVDSRFDLSAVSGQSDPGIGCHPYRLGRGVPDPDAPSTPRTARAGQYMVFAACSGAIPVSDEDASYGEAVAFFKKPRRASEFASQYLAGERPRVFGFLERLVNLQILSVS